MCGINGLNFKDINLLKKMSVLTSSRGPDNEDFFFSNEFSVSHNRLAIIDPEIRSNQPYIYENLVLSFNGEIYNYIELKNNLIRAGYKFDTSSDTEVIIKLFHYKGVTSFKDLSGIFSISIYDKNIKKLYLIRDIVGVKPLYYHYDSTSKKFLFSSLIKCLLLYLKNKQLNQDAVRSYSNFNRNDYRETFFKNIFKVLPGELVEVNNGSFKRQKFLNFTLENNYNLKNLNTDITTQFTKQFLSDVPVALSLSGGVDSNIILSELLRNKGTNFTNYSVTFRDSLKYQEDHDVAKKISDYFRVKFHSIEVTAKDFEENAEKIVDIVEEPTGNSNSISNLILSKNINQKVLFSGDGGDEVFTGYHRYKSIHVLSILKKFFLFNKFKINTKYKNFNRLFIDNSRELFLSFSEQNLFVNQNKAYKDYFNVKKNNMDQILNHTRNISGNPNLINVMYHDLDTWVPNDILNRNDKIYGNNGIEVRVPFLDKEIIEKYLNVSNYKKYGLFFNSKNILIKNYENKIKFQIKKKLGFNSPFASWLRKDIFTFAKNILSKEYYNSSNILDLDYCQKLINKHNSEYCDPYLIWNLISLQIFLRKYKF